MNAGSGAPPGAVMVAAPAKLTWSLRITGRREDGYHLLDAEMISLDLHDQLLIEPEGTGIVTTGPWAAGVPNTEDNLVHKALDFVGRRARVTITKNIPHGGGLGGGSSDAAAILRWARRTSDDDVRRSAALGADVPYCVRGGRARVTGIGEIVTSLAHRERLITLVIPPLSVSTAAVYRAFDSLDRTPSRIAAAPELDSEPINDLEPAALVVEPELRRWKDRVREVCGVVPTLAGSGATWFVPGHLGHQMGSLSEARVIETRTTPSIL